MKSKIALLLAVVMVLTSLPMTLLARSTNSVAPVVTSDAFTVWMERGFPGAVGGAGDLDDVQGGRANYWIEGNNLVIEVGSSNVNPGDTFQVRLEGAEWFFRRNFDYNVVPRVWVPGVDTAAGWVAEDSLEWLLPAFAGTTTANGRKSLNLNNFSFDFNEMLPAMPTSGTTDTLEDLATLIVQHNFLLTTADAATISAVEAELRTALDVAPLTNVTVDVNGAPLTDANALTAFGATVDVALMRALPTAGGLGLTTSNNDRINELTTAVLLPPAGRIMTGAQFRDSRDVNNATPATAAAEREDINYLALTAATVIDHATGLVEDAFENGVAATTAADIEYLWTLNPATGTINFALDGGDVAAMAGAANRLEVEVQRWVWADDSSTNGSWQNGDPFLSPGTSTPVNAGAPVLQTWFGLIGDLPQLGNTTSTRRDTQSDANRLSDGLGAEDRVTYRLGTDPTNTDGVGFTQWNSANTRLFYTRVTNAIVANSGNANLRQAPYVVEWSGSNWATVAQVTVGVPQRDANNFPMRTAAQNGGYTGGPYVSGDRITIPLVIRTTANNDVRVHIEQSSSAAIQNGAILSGRNAEGRTNTTSGGLTMAFHQISVGRIVIAEQRVGSIASNDPWEFELRAPRGYDWRWTAPGNGNGTMNDTTSGNTHFLVSGGLRWNPAGVSWANENGNQGRLNPLFGSSAVVNETRSIRMDYRRTNNSVDESVLHFFVPGNSFARSTTTTGTLVIMNLRLIPENPDIVEDGRVLEGEIRNVRGTVLTNQRFGMGTARDFGITLNTIDNEIPTLISGRLETSGVAGVSGAVGSRMLPGNNTEFAAQGDQPRIEDREHKAASVRFLETIQDSWWSERSTVFELPEEVRFLAVEIEDFRNITPNSTDGVNNLSAGTLGNGRTTDPNPWYNAGRRIGNVNVDHNRMTLTNYTVTRDETARFDMHIWLNIQVDFDGPVELTLLGSAFRRIDDNYNVVTTIANARSPIEVVTEVRDARIGFQFVSLADFEIIENVPGALLPGERVNVTITDLVSSDMAFAPGILGQVTDGNIRISNINNSGTLGTLGQGWFDGVQGGALSFMVERASSVPSTISFSNIQVKINRTIPFSNISNVETSGYDIHVWGPAVAKNFAGNNGSGHYAQHSTGGVANVRDFFSVGSISAHYVRIETPGELNTSPFANHVQLPIPGSSAIINGVETDLGVETWIDPVTSSAMVPIRFIAYALGLHEGAVTWDPVNSTVTIDAVSSGGRVVQFQTGNSAYLINGVAVRMMNSEGVPVEMQIRNERSFVPFRALGEAFGIPVSWDPDRAIAIYNAPTHFGQNQ